MASPSRQSCGRAPQQPLEVVEIGLLDGIADLVASLEMASQPEQCSQLVADERFVGGDRPQRPHQVPVACIGGRVSITDVRDLAAVLVALLEPGRGARRIMCGGHLLDMERLAGIYRELTGRRFPIAPVPPAALRGMGRVLDAVRRVVPLHSPMNEEGMTITTRWEGTVDSDLASLGVELRDPEETLADCLTAWHAAGLLSRSQMGDALGDPDPSEAPTPPKGFRASGRVLTSRPFRAVGPRVIPPFHRAVNRLTGGRTDSGHGRGHHRAVNRLTGGRTLLDSAAQPMLMLNTTGAKTGRRREAPLAAVPIEEGRFVLVGSNFALEHHPAWTANLIANPEAEIVFHGERTPVRARLLEGAERQQRWQTAPAWFPAWARYDAITERELRLFELQPVTDRREERSPA